MLDAPREKKSRGPGALAAVAIGTAGPADRRLVEFTGRMILGERIEVSSSDPELHRVGFPGGKEVEGFGRAGSGGSQASRGILAPEESMTPPFMHVAWCMTMSQPRYCTEPRGVVPATARTSYAPGECLPEGGSKGPTPTPSCAASEPDTVRAEGPYRGFGTLLHGGSWEVAWGAA